MQTGLRLTWIWPGLSRLWARGEWAGLVLALAFAASLNVALLATFVWPELLSRQIPAIVTIPTAWVFVLGIWCIGWMDFRKQQARLLVPRTQAEIATATDKLRLAQRQYLKGQFALAEQTVRSVLTPKFDDVELALLLVSILRRTARRDEGLRWIDKILGMSGASRWVAEIENENNRLRLLPDETPSPSARGEHSSQLASPKLDSAQPLARESSATSAESPAAAESKATEQSKAA